MTSADPALVHRSIFTNVSSASAKAKLRLVFEVNPLALLIENAGGFSQRVRWNLGHGWFWFGRPGAQGPASALAGGASSVDGGSALDIPITAYDQRTSIIYGSKGEVRRVEEYLMGESKRFGNVSA